MPPGLVGVVSSAEGVAVTVPVGDDRWRVVVADDDSDIRLLMEIAVRKAGMDLVAGAEDGEGALAAIRRTRPTLAVLDVSMPGMTGLDVCREVRDDPAVSGTTILVLSAGVDDASKEAALAAGADEFMSKPFSPRALAARLATIASGEPAP